MRRQEPHLVFKRYGTSAWLVRRYAVRHSLSDTAAKTYLHRYGLPEDDIDLLLYTRKRSPAFPLDMVAPPHEQVSLQQEMKAWALTEWATDIS